jgi:hypothetical protein
LAWSDAVDRIVDTLLWHLLDSKTSCSTIDTYHFHHINPTMAMQGGVLPRTTFKADGIELQSLGDGSPDPHFGEQRDLHHKGAHQSDLIHMVGNRPIWLHPHGNAHEDNAGTNGQG